MFSHPWKHSTQQNDRGFVALGRGTGRVGPGLAAEMFGKSWALWPSFFAEYQVKISLSHFEPEKSVDNLGIVYRKKIVARQGPPGPGLLECYGKSCAQWSGRKQKNTATLARV